MTRIALLGCGRIGKMHAATIVRAEGAELAAVYDPVTAAAEETGRRHGCTVAASAEEAIALADAVREVGLSWDQQPERLADSEEVRRRTGVVELGRRGHLTVLADPDA